MKKDLLKKGENLASKAIFLESFLAGGKVLIGLLSGSTVLLSDAIHSVSDITSIITSWLGLRIAQKDPTKKFPYGFYKAENLGALIISLLIFSAGGEMIFSAWQRLWQFSSVRLPYLALAISLIDAIVLFFFGSYEIKVGQEIGAESLTAMGKENRTHILSSSAVFLGTLAAIYKIPYIEGIVIFIISFLILQIGFETAKKALLALMDVSPDQEVIDRVAAILQKTVGIEDFFDLKLRQAGPYILGEVKVAIRRQLDLKRAHEIADKIEEEVKKKVPQVDSFLVHFEPFESNFVHLVIPVVDKNGLESKIAPRFGRSPNFLFVNLENEEIKGHYFLENAYRDKKVRAGLAVAKVLVEQKSDTLVVSKIGEISFHILQDNLFDIYLAKGKTAQEVIDNFLAGRLQLIKKPIKKES